MATSANPDGTVTTQLVELDTGATVALHEFGGDGPPLYLSHATGFSAKVYEVLASSFVEHHTVFGIDYRGHGESPAPTTIEGFGWERFADDVIAVCGLLDVSGIDCFAHSMGAAVVLLAEQRHPGLFRSGYLYEPITWATDGVPVPPTDIAEGARRRREVFADRAEAFDRYASRPPFGLLRADCLRAYLAHGFEDLDDGTVRLRCRSVNEAHTYEGEGLSTTAGLGSVTTPFTVAMGHPPIGPAQLSVGVVDALPNATLISYDHIGHFGPLQDPDMIVRDARAVWGVG